MYVCMYVRVSVIVREIESVSEREGDRSPKPRSRSRSDKNAKNKKKRLFSLPPAPFNSLSTTSDIFLSFSFSSSLPQPGGG